MQQDKPLKPDNSYSQVSSKHGKLNHSASSLTIDQDKRDIIPMKDRAVLEWNNIEFFVPTKKPTNWDQRQAKFD